MEILKKLIKFLLSLTLIALLAGSGYIMYDYSQNPAKYDDFAQMFQVKATGKDKITVEDASPFVKPEMTLTLDNTQYSGLTFEPHEEFEPTKPLILCYGKDMGGNLYIPIPDYCPDLQNPKLFSGAGLPAQDISEFAFFDSYHRHLEIQDELLMNLDAGEYYIIADFALTDGTGYYEAAIALILEEETTFNSIDRGHIPYYDDYCWIYNDLEDPKEITFTFYNLGDNPIRALLFDSEHGGAYLTRDMDPNDYEINEHGTTVTLKKAFLARQNVNTTQKFAVRLANGDTLDMGWTCVCTVKGDSLHPMTISGPETYSLSAGGDYVATIDPNDCTRYYACTIEHFPPDKPLAELFSETLNGKEVGKYLDTKAKTVTIPAEVMKSFVPNNGIYNIKIGYFMENIWCDAFLEFTVTD